jgi:hypothetical protein
MAALNARFNLYTDSLCTGVDAGLISSTQALPSYSPTLLRVDRERARQADVT